VDQRLLRVELLPGNRILLDQHAVAREIELRVLQQGLVARQLSLGLLELHLERARIDLGQEIAGADKLPFLESQTHQLPVDAALDRDGVDRSDRAETGEIETDVARPDRRGRHRSPASLSLGLRVDARSVAAGRRQQREGDRDDRDHPSDFTYRGLDVRHHL
jgi:hypothetical protein